MNKIRLLLAHPLHASSEVNLPMYNVVKDIPDVNAIDLYGQYPQMNIDIKEEQQALLDCDILLIQCPIYWYSIPNMVSTWFAYILQYGFAYGHDGDKLHGKKMMLALSAGGPLEAYQTGGLNNFSIRELFRHVEQTANMTGMTFLPPLVLGAARTAKEEGRVKTHVEAYEQLVNALINESIDEEKLHQQEIIVADDIAGLIKE